MLTADIPFAFQPDLRLLRATNGLDVKDYVSRAVRALAPHAADADIAERVTRVQSRSPITMADPQSILDAASSDVAARLRALGARVDDTARAAFVAMPDSLVSSSVTVAGAPFTGYSAGTVIWIRRGVDADLQFILPQLHVDTTTAEFKHRVPIRASQPAPHFGIVPLAAPAEPTARKVFESALEVASSVSWALPPPWNVGVTAGLSILQIIMRATDKPNGPSPMEQLKSDLETWMATRALNEKLQHVQLFTEDLLLQTKNFTFGVDQMAVAGTAATKDFQAWWHSPTGIDRLSDDVTSLLADLEMTKTIGEGSDLLAASGSGVTVWTNGQKVRMQLAACQLSAEMAAGHEAALLDSTASWRTILGEINDRVFDLVDPLTKQVVVKGWGSRIGAWINARRTERLAQLHDVERVVRRETRYVVQDQDAEAIYVDVGGWRFVDDADGDEWAHFVEDTKEGDACHERTVQHQDVVTTAFLDHRTQVIKTLDDALKNTSDTLAALKTKISDIAALQPPAPPKDKVPTVTLHTSGTRTPQGLWTKGATVTYQIAFANENGPSDYGPATPALEIGDFVGAALSNIPQDPKASAIRIARTIVPAAGRTPVVRHIQSASMGVTTADDVSTG